MIVLDTVNIYIFNIWGFDYMGVFTWNKFLLTICLKFGIATGYIFDVW